MTETDVKKTWTKQTGALPFTEKILLAFLHHCLIKFDFPLNITLPAERYVIAGSAKLNLLRANVRVGRKPMIFIANTLPERAIFRFLISKTGGASVSPAAVEQTAQ